MFLLELLCLRCGHRHGIAVFSFSRTGVIEILGGRLARLFLFLSLWYGVNGWGGYGMILAIEISGWLDGWVAGYVTPSNSLLLICSPILGACWKCIHKLLRHAGWVSFGYGAGR